MAGIKESPVTFFIKQILTLNGLKSLGEYLYESVKLNNSDLRMLFKDRFTMKPAGWLRIALISLSFGGAIGLMFLMLGCALPQYNSQYWPLFVLFFYILSPIPYCIARRLVDETDATSNACKELAIFLTTGIVVSAFGLPIVFARAQLILWGACALVLTGNTVIFATILGFFLVFGSNDDFSWQQW
ncbi:unnamed protein product [Lepidochelys olivacea]